jgi:hypothetical protein
MVSFLHSKKYRIQSLPGEPGSKDESMCRIILGLNFVNYLLKTYKKLIIIKISIWHLMYLLQGELGAIFKISASKYYHII